MQGMQTNWNSLNCETTCRKDYTNSEQKWEIVQSIVRICADELNVYKNAEISLEALMWDNFIWDITFDGELCHITSYFLAYNNTLRIAQLGYRYIMKHTSFYKTKKIQAIQKSLCQAFYDKFEVCVRALRTSPNIYDGFGATISLQLGEIMDLTPDQCSTLESLVPGRKIQKTVQSLIIMPNDCSIDINDITYHYYRIWGTLNVAENRSGLVSDF
jgi:hypothetical protein